MRSSLSRMTPVLSCKGAFALTGNRKAISLGQTWTGSRRSRPFARSRPAPCLSAMLISHPLNPCGGSFGSGMTAESPKGSALDVHEDRLLFPDTTVLFVHASTEGITGFVGRIPGAVTEIRKVTGTIEPFLDRSAKGLGPQDWTADLAKRIVPPPQDANAVCALDTGIAAKHPLITPALHGAWTYDAAWGADDHHPHGGHGTPLAGLALYGDLEPLMNDTRLVQLTHAVESMKLLPPRGFPKTKPPSYGVVTEGAVALVEAERPNVRRAFCLANSACDFPPERPSSWSGALDQIASGSMPGDQAEGVPAAERPKRLMVVATGNMPGGKLDHVRLSHPLEDPSQSWNVLTIGGFTRKETPPANPPGLKPVVPANHRSPFSLGSQTLSSDLTLIKPRGAVRGRQHDCQRVRGLRMGAVGFPSRSGFQCPA